MQVAEYNMCKACRRKAYKKYSAWNEFAERWATVGDSLKSPYVGCPGPIMDAYHNAFEKKVINYVQEHIPGAYRVSLQFQGEKLVLLGDLVPQWCPYKDTGWRPEDDMKMMWLNGEHLQDFAQRGKTYEFGKE